MNILNRFPDRSQACFLTPARLEVPLATKTVEVHQHFEFPVKAFDSNEILCKLPVELLGTVSLACNGRLVPMCLKTHPADSFSVSGILEEPGEYILCHTSWDNLRVMTSRVCVRCVAPPAASAPGAGVAGHQLARPQFDPEAPLQALARKLSESGDFRPKLAFLASSAACRIQGTPFPKERGRAEQ
jgi:hypothetical protein